MADTATLILNVTQDGSNNVTIQAQASSVSGIVLIGAASIKVTWNPLEYSYSGLTSVRSGEVVNDSNILSGELSIARIYLTGETIFNFSLINLIYISGSNNSIYVEVLEAADNNTFESLLVSSANETWNSDIVPVTPTDAGFTLQWHLHDAEPYGMSLESAWATNKGSGSQVALIELNYSSLSCRVTHEDFNSTGVMNTDWAAIVAGTHPCLLPGYHWDALNSIWVVDPAPTNWGHATNTTGDVVAQINNKGCVGVSPEVKVRNWYQTNLGVPINSVTKMIELGADVISSSTAFFCQTDTDYNDAALYAINHGVPVCQAAMYPDTWPIAPVDEGDDEKLTYTTGVIVVNGHGRDGTNQFPRTITTVSAPGGYMREPTTATAEITDQIYRPGAGWQETDSDSAYGYGPGTSHSAPFVAGILALIKAKNPTWTFGDLYQALLDGCKVGNGQSTRDGYPAWSPAFGWGCVDAEASLALDLANLRPVSPQRVHRTSFNGLYGVQISWFHTFNSNYDHTVIVRTAGSPAVAPTDGTTVYSGVQATAGTKSISSLHTPNGTWYFTVFNIGTDDAYSTTMGDSSMLPTYHGYLGFDSVTVTNYVEPVANFTEDSPVEGNIPLTVVFNDAPSGSVLATYRAWTFGDGGTSTSADPIHTYNTPGTYTVTYTCGNAYETDIKTKTDLVIAHYGFPIALFTQSTVGGTNPLTVDFTDQSVGGITDWLWDFGDGGTSDVQHPTHIYTSNGTYTVTLTVDNIDGEDAEIKPNLITVSAVIPDPPIASFTQDVTDGERPLTVQFTDTSTGGAPTTWVWNFSDGDASPTQNPTHTYDTPGTYTVTLIASNSGGTDTEEKVDLITVTYVVPVASFIQDVAEGLNPLTVQFTDTSTGDVTDWLWDFGDGGTSDTVNPSYTYTSEGTYTVTLTVSNSESSDSIISVDAVTTMNPEANFFLAGGYTVPINEATQFTNSSTGVSLSYLWDFGDGSTSTAEDPTHTYVAVGNYNVTLTVTSYGTTDSITKAVEVKVVAFLTMSTAMVGRVAKDSLNFTVTDNFKDIDLSDVQISLESTTQTVLIYDGAGSSGATYYVSTLGRMFCNGSGRLITFVFYPTTLFQAGVRFTLIVEYDGLV